MHADGRVEADPAPGEPDSAEPVEQREQALRAGWGDLLSWRRRGFDLLYGVAAAPPPYDACVLLAGDAAGAAQILLPLAGQGWHLLSDRPAPVVAA
ncbi:MAG: hypothetical protein JWO76_384, partial [Nocardioides sp.]|nr:hypothetical protein [Nocardioides sp.]